MSNLDEFTVDNLVVTSQAVTVNVSLTPLFEAYWVGSDGANGNSWLQSDSLGISANSTMVLIVNMFIST